MRALPSCLVLLISGALSATCANADLVDDTTAFPSANVLTFDEFNNVHIQFDGLVIGGGANSPWLPVGGSIGQPVRMNGFIKGTLGARSVDLGDNGRWDATTASPFVAADGTRFTNSVTLISMVAQFQQLADSLITTPSPLIRADHRSTWAFSFLALTTMIWNSIL